MILYPQFFNLSQMVQAKETTSEKCSPHRCGYKIMKRDNSQVFLLHCIVLGKTALMWWGSVLWKVKVARVCWVKWRRFVASWGGATRLLEVAVLGRLPLIPPKTAVTIKCEPLLSDNWMKCKPSAGLRSRWTILQPCKYVFFAWYRGD